MTLPAPSRLRAVALLSVAVLLSTASVLTTGSAGAAEPTTTYCSRAHPVTAPVAGNLVVPAHEVCNLGFDVGGNAAVEAGGALTSDGAGVAGHLHVGRNALVSDDGGRLGGYVVLDHAALFAQYNATVGGSVVGSLNAGALAYFQNADVLGRVAISGTGPDTRVEAVGLHVVGDTVFDSVRVELEQGATLVGRLELRNVLGGNRITLAKGVSFTGSVVCGGTVRGNVVVENAAATVEIGAGAVCRMQGSRLSTLGAFLAHDNTASIVVGGEVAGNAVCRDNTHHPRGDGSTTGVTALQVDGRRLGQCSQLPGP